MGSAGRVMRSVSAGSTDVEQVGTGSADRTVGFHAHKRKYVSHKESKERVEKQRFGDA